MKTEETTFTSDGHSLASAFFLPEEAPAESAPLLLICAGYTGGRDLLPAKFARYLTERGHICFGFDYRGEGASGGPRNRVLLEEQVRDIRHAFSYAIQDQRVDRDRVFILGWAMAAGMVLDASRELPGVAGLGCLNGFYSGRRFQEQHRSPKDLEAFERWIAKERGRRTRGKRPERVHPYEIYPLDTTSDRYMDGVRSASSHTGNSYSLEGAESLLRWLPESYAPYCQLPLLLAHTVRNELHPVEESKRLEALYGGPVTTHWMADGGHTEWVQDGNPLLAGLCEVIDAWVRGRREQPSTSNKSAILAAPRCTGGDP